MEKKKIYIIQTRIPHYRKFFFKNIKKDAQVVIISSKEKRINTIKSDRFDYSLEIKNFLGFIWLKNLPYQSFKNNFVIINGNMRILNNYIIFFLKYLFNYEIIWWGHLRSTRPAPVFDRIRFKLMDLFADKVILYTNMEAQETKKSKLIKCKKVFYLNNTIDQRKIRSYNKKKKNSNLVNFLFVGRLRERPNTLLVNAINVFSQIKRKNFQFTIIGEGSETEKIKSAIIKHKLQNKIFVKGEIYDENKISKYFLKSDFFLYPGYIGLSLMHSFFYSLPVITHDNRLMHAPEFGFFKNKFNGFSYQHNDFDDLKSILNKCIDLDANKIKRMRKNCKNTVKNLTIEKMVENFNKINFYE